MVDGRLKMRVVYRDDDVSSRRFCDIFEEDHLLLLKENMVFSDVIILNCRVPLL